MGNTLTYANKMNLAAMTSRGDLASTSYALARPGSEYLVYQPGSGTFSVDLQSGTYQIEWFNLSSGQTLSGGTVSGGESPSFSPPFSGSAVPHLKVLGGGATPTPTQYQ
jgi:Putative collagen-binding domain of a collagenase